MAVNSHQYNAIRNYPTVVICRTRPVANQSCAAQMASIEHSSSLETALGDYARVRRAEASGESEILVAINQVGWYAYLWFPVVERESMNFGSEASDEEVHVAPFGARKMYADQYTAPVFRPNLILTLTRIDTVCGVIKG